MPIIDLTIPGHHEEDGVADVLATATIAPQQKPRNRGDRSNSPRRWQEAYVRALEEDLRAFVTNRSPYTWFVTSGSTNQSGYTIDLYDVDKPRCSCTAATKGEDPVCKHRALVLARLGLLPKVRLLTDQHDSIDVIATVDIQ